MKIAIALTSCCLLAACASASGQSETGQTGAPSSAAASATNTDASAAVALPVAQAAVTQAAVTQNAAVGQDADASPASAQSVSVSQVRIVRLSQVTGQVLMKHKSAHSFDQAFMNLPIVAGAVLRTNEGLAEVEFEDNSSLRLTPESLVAFSNLGRSAAGSTVTDVNLLRGSMYVSLAESKAGGEFTIKTGQQSIVVTPSTHMRIDLGAADAKVVVFQGSATVTGPSGSLLVTKRKAVSFDLASSAAPQFTHVGEAALYDTWDKNAVDYHKVRTNALVGGLASSPYSYGGNDLNYYGSFADVGGCGTMWRPHLANAGFDPYSSGVWSWYPGQGYSWVSLYPWSWAPFHSGSWDYCPAGGGWGWRPQGTWRGLLNHPVTVGRGPGPVRPTPPAPPVRGGATYIAVNVKSLQPSEQAADGKFILRSGSAGLGVPRGVFSNLAKLSDHAETHGTASTYLSERQMQVGLMAPARSESSLSTTSANHSVEGHGASASMGGSSSFAASHSISTGPVSNASGMSSGSFSSNTAAPVSSASPSSSPSPSSQSASSHH